MMMEAKSFYKSRLRNKGQVTVPTEIRSLLGAQVGDDLLFSTDERGQVIISRAQVISPEQAWFWTERWQRLEYEAQSDLDAKRVVEYSSLNEALAALDQIETDDNAED
jgi:AbrB family looped-hinge helix DNA binding protein